SGYEAAYLWFGLGQGTVIMAVALGLRAPQAAQVMDFASALVQQSSRDYAPTEVLRSAPFWLMYAMFVLVGASGLTVTAQLAPVAKDFAIDDVPVSLLGLTMPALSFALSLGLVFNGLSRPFFGWVSDHLGRENTMALAFFLQGIGVCALFLFAGHPMLFVLFSAFVYFMSAITIRNLDDSVVSANGGKSHACLRSKKRAGVEQREACGEDPGQDGRRRRDCRLLGAGPDQPVSLPSACDRDLFLLRRRRP